MSLQQDWLKFDSISQTERAESQAAAQREEEQQQKDLVAAEKEQERLEEEERKRRQDEITRQMLDEIDFDEPLDIEEEEDYPDPWDLPPDDPNFIPNPLGNPPVLPPS